MDSNTKGSKDDLPADWTWERFRVVIATPPGANAADLLPVGAVVAFHSKIHNRYIRLRDNKDMDASDTKGVNELPDNWTWERFHVVDAGNGEIALWSEIHNRYIRMHENGNMDASGSKGKDDLPSDWTWERFKVVDGGNGQWALWNPIHNRYMRLHS